MPGYTYKPKEEIPKGMWKSRYGGFERTPFAKYDLGATVTLITRNQSADARRARIRKRKRARLTQDEYDTVAFESAAYAAEIEARITKEFHNG
jgi:hypothetical protein